MSLACRQDEREREECLGEEGPWEAPGTHGRLETGPGALQA